MQEVGVVMKQQNHAALAKKERRANRLNRVLRLFWRAVFLAVLVSVAVFAMTVFFKIDTITVEGAEKYASDEIISGMDIKKGDNLYLFNKYRVAEGLMVKFPYIAGVKIRRKLPDGLIVTIEECDALAAVPTDGGYFLLSGQGKVLERSTSDKGLPVVAGASLMGSKPGEMVDPTKDAYTDALLTILQTLDAADMLEAIDFINMKSLTDVRIGYKERFDIRIGTVDSLAYRMRFAKFVIEDRLSPSDVGRLYWDAKGRLHFVPDSLENVQRSGLVAPDDQPAEDEAPTEETGSTGDPEGAAGEADADAGEDPDSTGDEETQDDDGQGSEDDYDYPEEGEDDYDYPEEGEEEYPEDDSGDGYEDEGDYE